MSLFGNRDFLILRVYMMRQQEERGNKEEIFLTAEFSEYLC